MRTGLCRVAAITGAAVLTALLLPAGSASAAVSTDCVKSRSTRLFTSGANDEDRLWVDQQSPTRVVVCFRMESMSTGGVTIVADAASTVTLPDVHVGTSSSVCNQVVRHITDPVDVLLAVNLATNAVCISIEGSTTTVQFTQGNISGALPVFEVWRDGGTDWGWLDAAACPAQYAIAIAIGGPTTCMETNERLVP
jgi:hypothetical protein